MTTTWSGGTPSVATDASTTHLRFERWHGYWWRISQGSPPVLVNEKGDP